MNSDQERQIRRKSMYCSALFALRKSMATGHAAGVTAALSAQMNIVPRDLKVPDLQARLCADGFNFLGDREQKGLRREETMTQLQASRRAFLKMESAAPLATALPTAMHAAAAAAGPMKITRIEAVTFRKGIKVGGGSGGNEDAEWFWVRLHTDSGLVGTGETYPYSNAEIGALKDYSSQLLGRDPRDIDGIWRSYYKAMSMRNAGGADMRTLSAINMAQLDILGQASGLPLYRLLGGKTRSQIRVYNTTTDYWSMDNLRMGRDTLKIAAFLFDRGVSVLQRISD